MDVIKRMGQLYKKLGLSTDSALIDARYQGLVAACEDVAQEQVVSIVGTALGLKGHELPQEFMASFSEKDPAFDVTPNDKEAALLASSAIAYAFAENLDVGSSFALCLATASFGSTRPAIADDKLIELAEQNLSELQTNEFEVPVDRKYTPRGKTLTEAIAALEGAKGHLTTAMPAAQNALVLLGDYAEGAAKAAAIADNVILGYLRRLESEVRVYWWVSSGWSACVR